MMLFSATKASPSERFHGTHTPASHVSWSCSPESCPVSLSVSCLSASSTSRFSNAVVLPLRKNKLVQSTLHSFHQSIMNHHLHLPLLIAFCVLFYIAIILPVVQKQHQLLVTLLLCNAVAMEVIMIQLQSINAHFDFVYTSN